jgi:hypothetical protein
MYGIANLISERFGGLAAVSAVVLIWGGEKFYPGLGANIT